MTKNVLRFNPTVVRFELLHRRRDGVVYGVSIPQWCDLNEVGGYRCVVVFGSFNPTVVRFERVYAPPVLEIGGRFNPTVVRFEQQEETTLQWEAIGFNPTVVRFEHDEAEKRRSRCQVSIPQWCDLNPPPDFPEF